MNEDEDEEDIAAVNERYKDIRSPAMAFVDPKNKAQMLFEDMKEHGAYRYITFKLKYICPAFILKVDACSSCLPKFEVVTTTTNFNVVNLDDKFFGILPLEIIKESQEGWISRAFVVYLRFQGLGINLLTKTIYGRSWYSKRFPLFFWTKRKIQLQ